jgi:hypothetical protein
MAGKNPLLFFILNGHAQNAIDKCLVNRDEVLNVRIEGLED